MHITEYREQLAADGYQPGCRRSASEIDAPIAAAATCEACGHEGCYYEPFTRPGSYIALAVCPACGEALEF